MSIVVCKMPKAGLGNQLFPLMHAAVFARLNDLPLMVIGYRQLKLGPYLRNEKIKRNYNGYFKFEKNLMFSLADVMKFKIITSTHKVINEPALDKMAKKRKNKVYVFEKMPTYHDYFLHLKPHRKLAIDLLDEMISEKYKKIVNEKLAPKIGVHIRMGDFRKLNPGEVFKGGHVRTPESYFTDIINGIRTISGKTEEVFIFTDGRYSEFEELFLLSDIKLVEGNADIVDMMMLSKSKCIVISTGSTFSYWAGFLSEAPIIMHPDHIHSRIRFLELGQQPFEGSFSDWKKCFQ